MIYCNTVRYEGKNGVNFVTREDEGFVRVTIDGKEGEHTLEFSPALFATLTEAFKGVEAGKDYKSPDSPSASSVRVKPDISLHLNEEKVEIGFEERDDYNPVKDDWPTVVIRNRGLYLSLGLNPDQAKILMERCRQVVGLGAAVEDCASGMLEEKEA